MHARPRHPLASAPARALLLSLCALAMLGCRETPSLRATQLAAAHEAPARPPHVHFEPAARGEVTELVRAFVARAEARGALPLVYVGASWCEPCQYFHAAAERGELDATLPALALLEFDRDHDGARLDAAGYGSRMIPLFVSPNDDGTPSARRMEGSIHGPGSPAEITPRLLAILPPR